VGHGRQQARCARLGLASGGHNYLARLPRVCELVAARQTRADPHLGAQRAGRSDRSKGRTAQADTRSRERGAHGAQITSGTAPGIPAYVRPAGERASRGGTPAFTTCYSSMDGSRHRGGPPAGVGWGRAGPRGYRMKVLTVCSPLSDGDTVVDDLSKRTLHSRLSVILIYDARKREPRARAKSTRTKSDRM
jgi:hypothetical protein